jgi:hypothetical protein
MIDYKIIYLKNVLYKSINKNNHAMLILQNSNQETIKIKKNTSKYTRKIDRIV